MAPPKNQEVSGMSFDTRNTITWCPGCTNFGILASAKKALNELVREKKLKATDVVTVTGVGCASKIYDYLNTNAVYCLHGRNIPVSIGIKLGNPKLQVIAFGGDGDIYTEGSAHFLHACRYNVNMTLVVHSNQVFALTTGQATPITENSFKGKSTPLGVFGEQMNPIATALVNGATFVARGYALDPELNVLIKKAIEHKGFAYVDVIQPCITFHDNRKDVQARMYKMEKHDTKDLKAALKKSMEWNYGDNGKIPMGIFYDVRKKTFEESWPQERLWYQKKRKVDEKSIFREFE
jgi:2-oxoglutarate ferredoxin oxidoreductase subunit beta